MPPLTVHEHSRRHDKLLSRLTTSTQAPILLSLPAGAGRQAAAAEIAARLGRPLLTVQSSTVVSRYIGETEKNLAALVTRAEAAGAVLFFDEADALFGKRSEVRDAHDRYAETDIAWLMERLRQAPGRVIIGAAPPADALRRASSMFGAVVRPTRRRPA